MEATLLGVKEVREKLGGKYSLNKVRSMMIWGTIPSVKQNNKWLTTTKQVNNFIKNISFDAEIRSEKLMKVKKWA